MRTHAEAAKFPVGKTAEPKCPLCAGKVLYVGLNAVECGTFGCDNGPKTDPLAGIREELQTEFGLYSWFPNYYKP